MSRRREEAPRSPEERAQQNLEMGIADLVATPPSAVRRMLGVPAPNPGVRHGYGLAAHPQITDLLERREDAIRDTLGDILAHADGIRRIPLKPTADPTSPCWHNSWFFGLDAAALYGLVAHGRPRRYFEVGSGNSTMFARRSVSDNHLETRVVSIDPQPRAEIDSICDTVVRKRLEEVHPAFFSELEAGDIMFVDSSHIGGVNSDVTVFFLEILPRLAPGVLVHIHDIFLPWDYRPDWINRGYSEQYLLAAYLLGGGHGVEVILPSFHVFTQPRLAAVLDPIWTSIPLTGYETAGHSFWMRTL